MLSAIGHGPILAPFGRQVGSNLRLAKIQPLLLLGQQALALRSVDICHFGGIGIAAGVGQVILGRRAIL